MLSINVISQRLRAFLIQYNGGCTQGNLVFGAISKDLLYFLYRAWNNYKVVKPDVQYLAMLLDRDDAPIKLEELTEEKHQLPNDELFQDYLKHLFDQGCPNKGFNYPVPGWILHLINFAATNNADKTIPPQEKIIAEALEKEVKDIWKSIEGLQKNQNDCIQAAASMSGPGAENYMRRADQRRREWEALVEKANQLKRRYYLAENNLKSIDLHYMSNRGALALMKELLQLKAIKTDLEVVTGYGASTGSSVTKNNFLQFLSANNYSYTRKNDGAFTIHPKKFAKVSRFSFGPDTRR
ncbi:unnamed protein product, partial [Mesorhabditis spiculigera]